MNAERTLGAYVCLPGVDVRDERELFDNQPVDPPGWWSVPTITQIRNRRTLTITGLALAGLWLMLCLLGGASGAMLSAFGSGLAAAVYSPLAGSGALVGQRPAKRIWMAIFALISIPHPFWILFVTGFFGLLSSAIPNGSGGIAPVCISTAVVYGLAYVPFAGWRIPLIVMTPCAIVSAVVASGGEEFLGPAIAFIHVGCATTLGIASFQTLARAKRAIDPTHCASCGYNLEGNTTGLCPECGRVLTLRTALRRPQT